MPHQKTPDYSPAGILCPGGNFESSAKPHWCWVSDYYPGVYPVADGRMQTPDYQWSTGRGAYRWGFNGKEHDNEVLGEGNFQDYGMRMYNPRIARFISADPLIVNEQMYPELSPYQFASLIPIMGVDLDGLELNIAIDGSRYYGPVSLNNVNAKILSEGLGNPMYANFIIRQEQIKQDSYMYGSLNANEDDPLISFHWNSEIVLGGKYKMKFFGYGIEANASVTHNFTKFEANEFGTNRGFCDGNWDIELNYGTGPFSIGSTINSSDIQFEGKFLSYKPSYSINEGYTDRLSIIDLSLGFIIGGEISLSIQNPFTPPSSPPLLSKSQEDPTYTPAVSTSTSKPTNIPIIKF